ncbi:Histone acetyltransferase KAT7, partial [Orchesella cincta]
KKKPKMTKSKAEKKSMVEGTKKKTQSLTKKTVAPASSTDEEEEEASSTTRKSHHPIIASKPTSSSNGISTPKGALQPKKKKKVVSSPVVTPNSTSNNHNKVPKKEKTPSTGTLKPLKGTPVPGKGAPNSSSSGPKKKSQNGNVASTPPSAKKVVSSSSNDGKQGKSAASKNAKANLSTVLKSAPKINGGKVPPKPPKKHPPPAGDVAKKGEKKLEVSSSSTVGVATRRASRSTSCSSSASASASSSSSSSDSSSDSSNESTASKSNNESKKPAESRLSSTSTSTSTSGSGSSSSSSSDEDEESIAAEKTPVVRAPPAPIARKPTTAANRISKRDEKKGVKSRAKKPAESKVIKIRSSSSCSSSAERSSARSTTSSSSARSRSSATIRRTATKPTKTELSISSTENQPADIIQKHWQQIPRVKAKPPASTTFIIPSASDQEMKSAKEDEGEIEAEAEQSTRPVTRRQISKVKKSNKTIPTTTKFSLDKLHEKLESSSSPRVVYNEASDSDYSCGSGGDNQVFIRCVPAKSSTSNMKKILVEDNRICMFPGCDSNGHLSGLYEKHCLISCCPKYHIDSGFFLGRGEEESRTEDADPRSEEELAPRDPSEECQQLCRMRSNRMTARSHYTPASSNPLTLIPTSNHQKLFKNPNKYHPQPQEVKQWVTKMKELKDTKLDSNTSEYDMSLWRDALALAAAQIESEQNSSVQFNKWSLAMGKFEMGCWCCNPYPEPLAQLRRIFICEFCLKPVQSGTVLRRHCAKCVWRHPPGDEIYRKDRLSVWEVDGKTQKTYCQYLCLLAKCFLDHKTLYLDVDPFLFYVMTMADSQGCHIVGYFSKEKNSFLNYNVSCILTLPPYQRQGFGRLLIDFSYLLTRVEGKIGSPEKPLSDLGLISYRSYWKDAVLRRMCACASRDVSIKELSQELGISSADLVSTLQFLGMLKYWKGKHLILKKQDVLEEYLERVRRRGVEQRQIDSSCLRWRPYQPPPDNSQSQEESNSISSILNSVVSGGGGATTD